MKKSRFQQKTKFLSAGKALLTGLALYSFSINLQANGLAQLKSFLQNTQSFQADFTQQVTGKNKAAEHSSGKIELSRPNQFRWHYQKPHEQLILGDGQTLWIFDPDLNQVTRKSMSQALGATPAALLAGRDDLEKNYQLKALNQENDLFWVEATPKHEDSGFQSFRIGFRNQQIQAMILQDSFGQQTHLTFHNAKNNPKIPAARFRFQIPAGADVLDADE